MGEMEGRAGVAWSKAGVCGPWGTGVRVSGPQGGARVAWGEVRVGHTGGVSGGSMCVRWVVG